MVTRQSELIRILDLLAADLPDPQWVALVDSDGLVLASVPADALVNPESVSAMAAASAMMGERALREIDGGELRYTSVTGSKWQLLTVALGKERLLSIGLGPGIPAHTTFSALGQRVPELMRTLQKRFTTE